MPSSMFGVKVSPDRPLEVVDEGISELPCAQAVGVVAGGHAER